MTDHNFTASDKVLVNFWVAGHSQPTKGHIIALSLPKSSPPHQSAHPGRDGNVVETQLSGNRTQAEHSLIRTVLRHRPNSKHTIRKEGQLSCMLKKYEIQKEGQLCAQEVQNTKIQKEGQVCAQEVWLPVNCRPSGDTDGFLRPAPANLMHTHKVCLSQMQTQMQMQTKTQIQTQIQAQTQIQTQTQTQTQKLTQ